jgi:hypothetical protein
MSQLPNIITELAFWSLCTYKTLLPSPPLIFLLYTSRIVTTSFRGIRRILNLISQVLITFLTLPLALACTGPSVCSKGKSGSAIRSAHLHLYRWPQPKSFSVLSNFASLLALLPCRNWKQLRTYMPLARCAKTELTRLDFAPDISQPSVRSHLLTLDSIGKATPFAIFVEVSACVRPRDVLSTTPVVLAKTPSSVCATSASSLK